MQGDGLTDDEKLALRHLNQFWTAFLYLPEQHPAHKPEVAAAMHQIQRIIMCRPIERAWGLPGLNKTTIGKE